MFSDEPARLEMSSPHVAQLFEISKETADSALLADASVTACADDPTPQCVSLFLRTFAAKAFRRPMTAEELGRYSAFFQKEKSASDAPSALRQLVQALFMSPHFLYRTEIGDEETQGTTVAMTAFEKASSLAFTITNGPPDATLWKAAEEGQLGTSDQILGQVRRLTSSEKSALGMKRLFAEVWVYPGVAGVVDRDKGLYPTFEKSTMAMMAAESSAFIDQVLWKEGGKWSTMLTGGFSMVTGRLAEHYGIQNASPAASMSKLVLPPKERAGILTQGSFAARLAGSKDRFISLPGVRNDDAWKGTICTSDFFVSVANGLGVNINRFGDPSTCKGPLAQLA